MSRKNGETWGTPGAKAVKFFSLTAALKALRHPKPEFSSAG
jgi:hypothetical protein